MDSIKTNLSEAVIEKAKQEILESKARGFTAKEISEVLGLSKSQVSSMLKKAGLTNSKKRSAYKKKKEVLRFLSMLEAKPVKPKAKKINKTKKAKTERLIPQDSFIEEENKLKKRAKQLLAQCKEMEAQKAKTHQWVSEKYSGCKTRWLKRKVITL
ncbi:hypothetical protein [Ornithobacterium rhinotracheale]